MYAIHRNHLISSLELPTGTVFTIRHIDDRTLLKADCATVPAAKLYIDTLLDGDAS